MEHKKQKQALLKRMLRKGNGERRIVNAALFTITAHGGSNYLSVMKDVDELLEFNEDVKNRIVEAIAIAYDKI